MDLAAWLRNLGLEQYEPAFRANKISADLLPNLTADDLKDLGVTLVGDRRRLLQAIAVLRNAPAIQLNIPDSKSTMQPEAERRQLSVMFCDLVGSTELASRLDPEDLREVIGKYQACVAETVRLFDGFVAKYMGDGVLIYFGYPHAHEDDAEQAVRAGLALVDAVGELQAPQRLQVRIGIATGLVIVGDLIGEGSAKERAIVGETPNLAARLQGLAEPGAIVVAESTRRQIGALFEIADLGPHSLKGLAEPQHAWRVLAENRALGRFEALRSGATPLIGRDEELELLLRRWNQAKGGSGRVVLISAEPGIGKSRLAEALAERVSPEPHIRLRYFCSPHHRDSALYPIIAQMERAAGFARDDAPDGRLRKLEALLVKSSATEEETALIAALLSVPIGERYRLSDISPQRRKEETLHALLVQSERLSANQPVLMIFEDAHWIDPTSLELLTLTVERRDVPVLLLITARPEFVPPWPAHAHVTTLPLARLDRQNTATIVANVAGNRALSPDIVREIADRTDGVPLFVEELTKAVLESGAQGAAALSAVPHSALSVPATLHASLMARLDRLGPAAKEVAQKGAVIGREFGHELLASVADRSEPELREALDRLTNSGLLFVRGTPPQSTYIFKHALVQDAAYSTMLRGRRQQLHARTAEVLEQHFSELVRTEPELIALHYERAGKLEKSFHYWVVAGNGSEQRGATAEAISHYRAAYRLIGSDPSNAVRLREPEVGMRLGNALMQAEGYNSEAGRHAYQRARSAAAELDLAEEYARAGTGIAPLLFGQCRYSEAIDILEDISSKLLNRLRPQTRVHLWTMLGVANCTGELRRALEYETRAIDLDSEVGCTHENPVGGADPAVVARSYAALSSTSLGWLEQSRTRSEEAWTIAQARHHAFSIAWAGLVRLRSLVPLGRYSEAMPIADECVDICDRHGFNARLGNLLVYRGVARFRLGEASKGLADTRRGIALWRRTSGSFHVTQWISELVRCLLLDGSMDEADHALRDAEEIIAIPKKGVTFLRSADFAAACMR